VVKSAAGGGVNPGASVPACFGSSRNPILWLWCGFGPTGNGKFTAQD